MELIVFSLLAITFTLLVAIVLDGWYQKRAQSVAQQAEDKPDKLDAAEAIAEAEYWLRQQGVSE